MAHIRIIMNMDEEVPNGNTRNNSWKYHKIIITIIFSLLLEFVYLFINIESGRIVNKFLRILYLMIFYNNIKCKIQYLEYGTPNENTRNKSWIYCKITIKIIFILLSELTYIIFGYNLECTINIDIARIIYRLLRLLCLMLL